MKLIFNCPVSQKMFESDAFKLTHNEGVKTDAYGQRYLDARVSLSAPCPHCGEFHSFSVGELACPFDFQRLNDDKGE